MKGYEAAVFILAASMLLCSVNAQYWFQFGATGDQVTYHNSGAAVTIQTALQPSLKSGSMGFWIGENLANGAFIQAGYVIENQSGNYPSYCNAVNCTKSEYIKKGQAEWFYEYFLPNSNTGNFMGAIGPAGSAGVNGTSNRYSFYYSGSEWHIVFNGNDIGNVNLGTDSSGNNAPVAFGELANTSDSSTYIVPVLFSNMSFYNYAGLEYPVPHGYSYIGYGVGSEKALQNPYGVGEADSRVNYFKVGSGLQRPSNGYELWNFGYALTITSKYGTGNTNAKYQAYSTQQISEPEYVYLGNDTRAAFNGWTGTGSGSYTGIDNSTIISIAGNITETANWQTQYLVTVNSSYGAATGTGWYNAGSLMHYSVGNRTYYSNKTTRYIFENWSNGNKNPTGTMRVNYPTNITAAFMTEYYVNATSEYGSISGVGWYANETNAVISLSNYTINASNTTRTSFYAWSNGSISPHLSFVVTGPVNITAVFKTQYLTEFRTTDEYGNGVFPPNIYISGKTYGNNAFLFPEHNYSITGVYYDGMQINMNKTVLISRNGIVFVNLPLYNVNVTLTDLFGSPVNTTIHATFANGTSRNILASDGRATFMDIPYGNVSITATYSGITNHASASGGKNIKLLFVSIYNIAAFVAIIAVAFVIYFISRRALHGDTWDV